MGTTGRLKTVALWIIAIFLVINAISPVMAKSKAPTTARQIAALQKQVDSLTKQNKDLSKKVGGLQGQMKYYANLQSQVNQLASLAPTVQQLAKNQNQIIDYINNNPVTSINAPTTEVAKSDFDSLKNRVSDLENQVGSRRDWDPFRTLWGHINDIESRLK